MQIDSKFKKLMIDCPDLVRKAVLSDHQIRVFKIVKGEGGMYSRHLSEHLGVSVQSAGATLSRLVDAGYLQKYPVNAPSGGTEYFYRAAL